EEKYRRLMETANDAIFTADLKSGIIVDANRKAAELLARPPEKLIGLHYSQLFSAEDAERYRNLFRRPGMKGGFIEGDIQVIDSAGRGIPVEISTSRVKVGGRHLVTGIFRDISERQRAEEEKASLTAQLIQAQKIEALGTLAGGIAHDFNNLLTGVLGNISLAMLDQEEDSPSRDRLTAAEKACLQAQGLARQLLTFAKGGAPIKELISLESLITETACLAAIGSQVKCKFNFPDSLWAAEVDPGQISQVFQNLVINAIQAMPAGGTITVQGENLEVAQQNELPLSAGRYVKIVVQDQGIGISPNYLPRVFDPYFTTKPGGNGLGLTTVYSIVRNHGGHIMVESSLGRGTTFQVFLPAVTREATRRREENRQASSKQLKILVMDDEEIVRDLLDKMLGHLGYRATLAKDGAEALELFIAAREAGENFSAVILDLTVPGGMGGKTALEQFLRIDPQIKAIVSSGYSDDPTMAEFAQTGFSGVITKPYRIAELSRVLNQVLANHLVITANELS
ncbi:MAG: ATP-binding protein, partial [Deltaproteobacteria bacterium]|nr:ATP-binding protein [Deltaproteobacteria bacterium]